MKSTQHFFKKNKTKETRNETHKQQHNKCYTYTKNIKTNMKKTKQQNTTTHKQQNGNKTNKNRKRTYEQNTQKKH